MKVEKLYIVKSKIGSKEISFQDGINFITGPNGTGKSTILSFLNREKIEGASYIIEYSGEFISDLEFSALNNNYPTRIGIPLLNISIEGIKVENRYYGTSSFSSRSSEKFGKLYFVYNYDEGKSFYLAANSSNGIFYVIPREIAITYLSVVKVSSEDNLDAIFSNVIFKETSMIMNKLFLKFQSVDLEEKLKVIRNKDFRRELNQNLNLCFAAETTSISKVIFDDVPVDSNIYTDKGKVYNLLRFVDHHDNTVELKSLSSGQKRSIINSISMRGISSETVLFDEPTNYLSKDLMKTFARHISSSKKQIIIVTHRSEFVYEMYKELPFIIKVTEDKVYHFDLKLIKAKNHGIFTISFNARPLIESLFSKRILVLEGPDDERAIMVNSQINEFMNKENISVISAHGFAKAMTLIKFLISFNIDFLAFVDNDVQDGKIIDDNIHYTTKMNLEDYLIPEILNKFEKSEDIKRTKGKVREYYDKGEFIYTKEFYDEVWKFITKQEPLDKYDFSWI